MSAAPQPNGKDPGPIGPPDFAEAAQLARRRLQEAVERVRDGVEEMLDEQEQEVGRANEAELRRQLAEFKIETERMVEGRIGDSEDRIRGSVDQRARTIEEAAEESRLSQDKAHVATEKRLRTIDARTAQLEGRIEARAGLLEEQLRTLAADQAKAANPALRQLRSLDERTSGLETRLDSRSRTLESLVDSDRRHREAVSRIEARSAELEKKLVDRDRVRADQLTEARREAESRAAGLEARIEARSSELERELGARTAAIARQLEEATAERDPVESPELEERIQLLGAKIDSAKADTEAKLQSAFAAIESAQPGEDLRRELEAKLARLSVETDERMEALAASPAAGEKLAELEASLARVAQANDTSRIDATIARLADDTEKRFEALASAAPAEDPKLAELDAAAQRVASQASQIDGEIGRAVEARTEKLETALSGWTRALERQIDEIRSEREEAEAKLYGNIESVLDTLLGQMRSGAPLERPVIPARD